MAREYRFEAATLPPAFQGFRFNGGALPLHLVETVHAWQGRCIDRIDGADAWNRWLVASGNVAPADDASGEDLGEMRRLREAIYLVAGALSQGRQAPLPSIAVINDVASRSLPTARIVPGANAALVASIGEITHGDLLTRIAREAVDLFTGALAGRIRQCAEEGCPAIFVDRSRSGSRVWCSSACGARIAARSYRRRRSEQRTSALS